MKKILQIVLWGIGIACSFYFAIILAIYIGFILGVTTKDKEEANSNSMTQAIKEIESDYKDEMMITNALLNGLHWCMVNDSSLWKSSFVTTLEYQNIDTLVLWGDFYDSDWNAKELPDAEDLKYYHE